MKKISTLFKKDPNDLGRVIGEINLENEWVFNDKGVIATRKYDGTACAIIEGRLYRRYDVKKGREIPEGAIPCQEADPISGHHPHWVLCSRDNKADVYHFEAFDKYSEWMDGTYELCGEKIQGNPEKFIGHELILHGVDDLDLTPDCHNFESFKNILTNLNIEGIVFHHTDGRMCKLRKSDYGIKRQNQ